MKKVLFVILFLVNGCPGWTQFLQLSERAEILAITASPGQEQLYAAFGHSAFRVVDPVNRIDWVYNYGSFDFNRPNFYLNFARGHLIYQVAKGEYRRFNEIYAYFNRTLTEQVLNLTFQQKQKLFNYLENNALPENKDYYYDYFYNNCATKLRDVLIEVFGDSIRFDGSYINTKYSFRNLVDIYTPYQPWGDLGIDICLGLPMDKTLSPDEYMFLPDYIYQGFNNAYIKTSEGEKKLISRELTTNQAIPMTHKNTFYTPPVIFWLILIIGIGIYYLEERKKQWFKAFDFIWFFILGFLGLFLLGLWFLTDHASQWNFNLMWAIPSHFFIVFLFFGTSLKIIKKYYRYVFYFTIFLLVSWYFLPQEIHLSIVPLAILSGLRSYRIYRLK